MEEETVDCFKVPLRFQPEANDEDKTRERVTTDAAINIIATEAGPNKEVAVPI
jgi:hypothetical protein